ncbi:hypothetical protein ACQVRV_00040 (plasmid) [Ralstonia pseudosolanacearum]
MTTNRKITLDTAVCPACAVALPKQNEGCPHCHYAFGDNHHGRVGTLREILAAESGQFNNVSPAFLRLVVQAAAA